MKLSILSDPTFYLTPAMLVDLSEHVEVDYLPAENATAERLSDAEIIFGCPSVELLPQLPWLRWHHLPNAAIQPYISPDLYANPQIILSNSRGVYGAAAAEHVAAMALGLARQFPLYNKRQNEQIWQREDYGATSVENSTAAIFGLGDLGGCTAKKLKALGAYIIGVRRSLLDKPPYVDELFDLRATREVLSRSDFVINCLPWTQRTEKLFNQSLFKSMKKSAYFINIGRGKTVDTEAMVAALQSGTIAGAALDVTDPEPLPQGHPLWQMPNVTITPHASCVSEDVQQRKVELFLRQLEKYQSKRAVPNRVNFANGY
ncbi:dehydrogenase [Clostridia bacterium]|nr:dehydrogenase [Clostridia bacterium]